MEEDITGMATGIESGNRRVESGTFLNFVPFFAPDSPF
jgi:hypothetical protein